MPYLKPKLTTVTSQPRRLRRAEGVGDPLGELVHVEGGGVDDEVGVAAQVGQHAALALEAVEQPSPALQRVRTTGRLLPADQHVVGGVEEDQRGGAARGALGDRGVQGVEEGAGPDVDDDRHGLGGPEVLVDEADDVLEQVGREVVDDVEAEVLELLGGGAAAGPGHAGDDDELAGGHRRSHGGLALGCGGCGVGHDSSISPVAVLMVVTGPV